MLATNADHFLFHLNASTRYLASLHSILQLSHIILEGASRRARRTASATNPRRWSPTASTRPSRAGATGIQDPALPSETYTLTDTRFYTAPDQELSTAGYPTGDNRAINNGTGHTTAVDA